MSATVKNNLRQRAIPFLAVYAIFIFSAFCLSGCGENLPVYVYIGDITNNSAKYEGQNVTVHGKVSWFNKLPMLVLWRTK
ncbi:MAG: hypothetical protein WC091_02190 [Sulfuricellaceae bacterium]